ncbi:MAG: hydrogenase 4 subunit B [Chloroflexi bacterium]|nr:hydrogenase 4 subunit B [Chloroflexota bacterium]
MEFLLQLMLGAYVVGAAGSLLGGDARWGQGLAALGATLGAGATLALGAVALLSSATLTLTLPGVLPLVGVSLRVDGLSAFFLVVVGLVGMAAGIYGYGYAAAYVGRYSLRRLGLLLNLLLWSLSLLVLADNALIFLLVWEVMSLSAYLLVLTESDQPGTVRAGNWYLSMTHAGFAALLGMFLMLSGGDLSTSFQAMREQTGGLSPLLRDIIFVLALIGFGAKAGIVPLHIWLPMAHPVAPSHVSALMSGLVIKTGVYGLVRVALDLLGGGPVWWGGTILALGAISALLGVLYALMEHDLKRLLAYHSVENIGIILIGVGAGLVFQRYGLMTLAALGLIGGLYHTINHATFKGLLFLGAGSVLHATHTRNMEDMGGLIKPMPWTAAFFLIGAAAISALPPLNGFASEWLVFQSLLGSAQIPVPEIAVFMPVAVGMLALTSGLAAACFVKAFGITFLAIPRSHEAAHAHEAPLSMRLGMGILAVVCVALGLAPAWVTPLLGRALTGLGGLPDTQTAFTLGVFLHAPDGFGRMSPLLTGLGLLVLLVAIPLLMRLLRVNQRLRMGDSWGCGRIGQTPRMEYTATAFAEPLRRVFAELYRPSKELTIDFHPESRYFVQSIAYKSEISPLFERWFYEPLLALIQRLARLVRRLQAGSLHLYLAYVVVVLVILLLSARWYS